MQRSCRKIDCITSCDRSGLSAVAVGQAKPLVDVSSVHRCHW